METVLDVKLADCLGQTPQDFLAVRDAQVRVPWISSKREPRK
jgi:hypothetical protein